MKTPTLKHPLLNRSPFQLDQWSRLTKGVFGSLTSESVIQKAVRRVLQDNVVRYARNVKWDAVNWFDWEEEQDKMKLDKMYDPEEEGKVEGDSEEARA